MAIVIYGAGAIGGVLGARLADAGHDVTLIARGAHLDAIRRHGLRLESPERTTTLTIAAVESPHVLAIDTDDVVVLAMKSQDTAAALAELRSVADRATPVVCAQNGVANEPAALRLFEHVYGVCVMSPTAHLEPGVVQSHSAPIPGLLDLGRYPHGVDTAAVRIAAAFVSAGFVSEPRPDIMRWKYRKLIMNLGNAVQAVCGSGDGVQTLLDQVRAEGEACLRAAGIDVIPERDDRARRGDLLQVHDLDGRERGGGSSWQSLRRSTGTIEADYLNGEIVLLGREHGVPAPANELVRQYATALARERRPPGSVPARELLDQLG